jgi:hypothetical protein
VGNRRPYKEDEEAIQKIYDCAKACIYANEAYFEFKKLSSSLVSDLKKNQS